MALYTFHSFRTDGSPVSLDSFELPSQAEALAQTRRVFREHGSAQSVVVCLGEVEIATVRREEG